MNGCSISHSMKVITLTKAFAEKASNPGTKEFRHLTQLHKSFPDYDIVRRTATNKKEKEKHTGLTIERMEAYIKTIIHDDAGLNEFHEVKTYYKGVKGYYGKVKGWFLNKYPDYQDIDFTNVASSNKSDNSAGNND